MKPLKSTLALFMMLLATAVSGSALARDYDRHSGRSYSGQPRAVAPRSSSSVQFGFGLSVPLFVPSYEYAPYYYYPAPAPYYYYEPAPYYYDYNTPGYDSPFPRSSDD